MAEPEPDPQPNLTAAERQIFADIAEHGVHIVHVPASDGAPEYAYTLGLWHTYQHPEVLVLGLAPEVASDLLEGLTDEIDAGRAFAAGAKCEGLVAHYPVWFGVVTAAQVQQWLPRVGWIYDGAEVACVQLVYPDKQGRWPWQDDVRDGFRALQPVLERQNPTG